LIRLRSVLRLDLGWDLIPPAPHRQQTLEQTLDFQVRTSLVWIDGLLGLRPRSLDALCQLLHSHDSPPNVTNRLIAANVPDPPRALAENQCGSIATRQSCDAPSVSAGFVDLKLLLAVPLAGSGTSNRNAASRPDPPRKSGRE
jgi:hypothetical protein